MNGFLAAPYSDLDAGNTTSYDTYVLENKILIYLKKDLNKMIIDYFNKIEKDKSEIFNYLNFHQLEDYKQDI